MYKAVIGIVLIIIGAVIVLYQGLTSSNDKVRASILNFLLLVVIEAEQKFKSKTGKIKFAYVYDKYLVRYPIVSKFIPKSVVELLIEQCIIEMRLLIEENTKIKELIEGE